MMIAHIVDNTFLVFPVAGTRRGDRDRYSDGLLQLVRSANDGSFENDQGFYEIWDGGSGVCTGS